MSQCKPSIVGAATSLTVGFGYILCAISVVLFPDQSYSFLSSLFHGGNVSMLEPRDGAFTFWSFCISLVGLMASGFAMGAFYSWVYNSLNRKKLV
jgi:hypothetical protein